MSAAELTVVVDFVLLLVGYTITKVEATQYRLNSDPACRIFASVVVVGLVIPVVPRIAGIDVILIHTPINLALLALCHIAFYYQCEWNPFTTTEDSAHRDPVTQLGAYHSTAKPRCSHEQRLSYDAATLGIVTTLGCSQAFSAHVTYHSTTAILLPLAMLLIVIGVRYRQRFSGEVVSAGLTTGWLVGALTGWIVHPQPGVIAICTAMLVVGTWTATRWLRFRNRQAS